MVNDAEYHTLIQQEQMTLNTLSPFLHLSLVDLTGVLYVSILSEWISRYLRLVVHSMT